MYMCLIDLILGFGIQPYDSVACREEAERNPETEDNSKEDSLASHQINKRRGTYD